MTASALALVLAAALCHATWNLAAKKVQGGDGFVLLGSLVVIVLWAPLALWAGWHANGPWGPRHWGVLAASAAIHVAYFRTLLHGYAVSDLTVVYPVARGSGPLLSSLGAVLVLRESLSMVSVAGALSVVGGVFLIAGGPGLWRQANDPARRDRVRLGLRWGALTGAFIAGYTVLDGYAVKTLLISPILVDYLGNVLRVPLLLPLALRNRADLTRAWTSQRGAAVIVGTLGPLSYIMVLYAVQMAPLSHVAPAREVSMLFAALAGGTLLGESDRWMRLAGAGAIAAGVGALALG